MEKFSPAESGVVAVIPARYGSSRLPGKPLAEIGGRPMILWVVERAAAMAVVEEVAVATDSEAIARVVEGAGFPAVMTRPDHPSGTDRIAEAARALGLPPEAVVVNIQGDQPLVEEGPVAGMVELLQAGRFSMTTCATPLDPAELHDPNRVKVVVDLQGRALYFSRSPIPYDRDGRMGELGMVHLRHLGLYAYRNRFLQRFVELPVGRLEQVEQLEQLRALENGYSIGVALVDHAPPDVDTPEDLHRVARIMAQGGA